MSRSLLYFDRTVRTRARVYQAAVQVFLEAVPVSLVALVLRENRVVGAEELLVANLVGADDPEMRFAITDFRTSPRR